MENRYNPPILGSVAYTRALTTPRYVTGDVYQKAFMKLQELMAEDNMPAVLNNTELVSESQVIHQDTEALETAEDYFNIDLDDDQHKIQSGEKEEDHPMDLEFDEELLFEGRNRRKKKKKGRRSDLELLFEEGMDTGNMAFYEGDEEERDVDPIGSEDDDGEEGNTVDVEGMGLLEMAEYLLEEAEAEEEENVRDDEMEVEEDEDDDIECDEVEAKEDEDVEEEDDETGGSTGSLFEALLEARRRKKAKKRKMKKLLEELLAEMEQKEEKEDPESLFEAKKRKRRKKKLEELFEMENTNTGGGDEEELIDLLEAKMRKKAKKKEMKELLEELVEGGHEEYKYNDGVEELIDLLEAKKRKKAKKRKMKKLLEELLMEEDGDPLDDKSNDGVEKLIDLLEAKKRKKAKRRKIKKLIEELIGEESTGSGDDEGSDVNLLEEVEDLLESDTEEEPGVTNLFEKRSKRKRGRGGRLFEELYLSEEDDLGIEEDEMVERPPIPGDDYGEDDEEEERKEDIYESALVDSILRDLYG